MRASKSLLHKHVYEFGGFRLDAMEGSLARNGVPVSLTPALVEHRGHIVEKEELMKLVWPGTFVEDDTVIFNISVLRKVLDESSGSPRFIETVPKRGYRFIAGTVAVMGEDGTRSIVPTVDTPPPPPVPKPLRRTRSIAAAYLLSR